MSMAPFNEFHKPTRNFTQTELQLNTRILTEISINGQYLDNGDTLYARHGENVHHKLIGCL